MGNRMKKIAWILILLSFCLVSCKGDKDKKTVTKNQKIIVVKKTPFVQNLYFSGTIQPVNSKAILSKVSGSVRKVLFKYGEMVKENQLLFVLSSEKLATDYQQAINDYLEKKQAYQNGQKAFQGDELLYKAGVTSRNDYLTEQSAQQTKALDYVQAKMNLEKILAVAGVDSRGIEKLSIKDTDDINKLLQKKFEDIKVYSTATGVALIPSGAALSASASQNAAGMDQPHKLVVGSLINKDQLLLSVGDLSGLTVKVKVNEVDIKHIKVDQKVVVTGEAFLDVVLHGSVLSVASQAEDKQGDDTSVSLFDVIVKVPSLSVKQQRAIDMGMTAKVNMPISMPASMQLPIDAVSLANGKEVVKLLDKNNQAKEQVVTTGKTTIDKVIILTGLKPGDRVLVAGPSDD